MSQNLERARLLMDQDRWEDAAKYLKGAIAEDPADSEPHTLLAFCCLHNNDIKGALESARNGVALDPDYFFPHYGLAVALYSDHQFDKALKSIKESIRIDPEYADSHALLGELHAVKHDWENVMQAADTGLEYEPENSSCLRLKATALSKLNRSEEAEEMIQSALSIDPEDSYNLSTNGWHRVEKGEYDQASEFFKNALRLDPFNEEAKSGLMEVLKGKSIIFRPLLRYHLFMSRLKGKSMWGFIIGAYIIFRILKSIASSNPSLEPFITPLIVVYLIFVLYSWLGEHVFNLLLRLHPLGKHILDRYQIQGSNWMAGLLAGSGILFVAWHYTGISGLGWACVFCAMLSIPFSTAFGFYEIRGRKRLQIYAYAMSVFALLSVFFKTANPELAVVTIAIFFVMYVVFFWFGNWILIRPHT